jgi:trk system potassium uptake protein TrkA
MRIVVVGAGTVGSQLAARLSEENHDVIVIDQNFNNLRSLDEYYDLQTLVGDGASVAVLRKAKIEDADLVIAVTNHDTTNVMVCRLAKNMDLDGRAYRLARIRSNSCFDDHTVLAPSEQGVDRVIYPEELAADKIHRKDRKSIGIRQILWKILLEFAGIG